METKNIDGKIELTKRDDRIYVYKTLKNSTIELETVEKMTKIGDEWNGTEICANLVDIRDVLFIDSKARNYGAQQYRSYVAGMAILIESRFSSYFANLLLKFNKPKVPTKLFTQEAEAIEWLQNQIRNYK